MKIDKIIITVEPYEQDVVPGTNRVINIDVVTDNKEHHFQRILHKSEVVSMFDKYMETGIRVLKNLLMEEENIEEGLKGEEVGKKIIVDKIKEIPRVEDIPKTADTDIPISKTEESTANASKLKSNKVGELVRGIMMKGKKDEQQ